MELKELKKQVKCMPRDTVVDLMTPTGITVRYSIVLVIWAVALISEKFGPKMLVLFYLSIIYDTL